MLCYRLSQGNHSQKENPAERVAGEKEIWNAVRAVRLSEPTSEKTSRFPKKPVTEVKGKGLSLSASNVLASPETSSPKKSITIEPEEGGGWVTEAFATAGITKERRHRADRNEGMKRRGDDAHDEKWDVPAAKGQNPPRESATSGAKRGRAARSAKRGVTLKSAPDSAA